MICDSGNVEDLPIYLKGSEKVSIFEKSDTMIGTVTGTIRQVLANDHAAQVVGFGFKYAA